MPDRASDPRATASVDAPRANVLGVHVCASTFDDAIAILGDWVETGRREYVTFTGVHGVMEAQRDDALLKIHNTAGFVACDGMPLVWSCRAAGYAFAERVYGPDAMLAITELAAAKGWRVFYYGGAPGTAELLAERLATRFPGLQLAGLHSPPFRDLSAEEIDAEIEMINASHADIVWVGLSTPKQERWMAARRGALDASLLCGVGAAFDFHAGLVRQAPRWVQRSGLEWLFRLGMEPRRLWRRYLRNNPAFVAKIARSRPTPLQP
jgi:N-acetylglucosaminyldiphosphoundecaprenol N-acetyl-beta-D-mannosaminyltransferase